MRRPLFAFAAALALALPLAGMSQPAAAATAVATAADATVARVIVKFRASAATMQAQSARPAEQRFEQRAGRLSARTGLALTDGHPIGASRQVMFARGMTSEQLAARLSAEPDVEFAEPDHRRHISAVPNDPFYPGGQTTITPTVGQWYLRPPASANDSAIDAQTAWDTTMGTSAVVVAVLDTGVRYDHPDLAGKLYPGYDFISDKATANDGGGRDPDASDPGDWLSDAEVNTVGGTFYGGSPSFCSDLDPSTGRYMAEDSSWHGTQVAGLIGAATDNGIGMASVGRNVMILPVRVLGKCGGFDSDIQAAMLWAAGLSSNPIANPHPAKIINLSLGSATSCGSYASVISQLSAAGVSVVASAGNGEGLAVDAPANCPGAIGVGGVRNIGTKVGYSNVGPEVAISAPAGNCVNLSGACLDPLLTSINTGTTTPAGSGYSDSFVRPSLGTSFSAPLVSGTAALMLSVDPGLTPSALTSALKGSARPFPTTGAASGTPVCHAPNGVVQDECYCTTATCGAGLLDTRAAVAAVMPAAAPTAPLSASNVNPSVGQAVSLDASAATVATGSGTYSWTVGDTSVAALTGPTNTATTTVQALAAGQTTVTLTVTDSMNVATSSSVLLTVGPAQVTSNPPPSTSSGGGGAIDTASLACLLAILAAVAWQARRATGTSRVRRDWSEPPP